MTRFSVNGKPHSVPGGQEIETPVTVALVLEEAGFDPVDARGIAVALNDRVVRRADWSRSTVNEGDRVEIVTARQGG